MKGIKAFNVFYYFFQWQIQQDGTSPAHSTPIKIDSHNQFVPMSNGDRNEFKRRQREVNQIFLYFFYLSIIFLFR